MPGISRRYLRTVLLGVATLGVLLWSAVDQFDVPPRELYQLFLATLLVVGAVIVIAGVAVLLLQGVRRLCRRGD